MSLIIKTSIKIDASAEKVWQVLTNFAAYPEWNPFMRIVAENFTVGKMLQVRLEPAEGKSMVFNPVISQIDPLQRFVWQGRVLFVGLFDGEHRFEIKSRPEGGVIFHHSESFSGLLSCLILKMIGPCTEVGFSEMNLALKQRVEGIRNEKI